MKSEMKRKGSAFTYLALFKGPIQKRFALSIWLRKISALLYLIDRIDRTSTIRVGSKHSYVTIFF